MPAKAARKSHEGDLSEMPATFGPVVSPRTVTIPAPGASRLARADEHRESAVPGWVVVCVGVAAIVVAVYALVRRMEIRFSIVFVARLAVAGLVLTIGAAGAATSIPFHWYKIPGDQMPSVATALTSRDRAIAYDDQGWPVPPAYSTVDFTVESFVPRVTPLTRAGWLSAGALHTDGASLVSWRRKPHGAHRSLTVRVEEVRRASASTPAPWLIARVLPTALWLVPLSGDQQCEPLEWRVRESQTSVRVTLLIKRAGGAGRACDAHAASEQSPSWRRAYVVPLRKPIGSRTLLMTDPPRKLPLSYCANVRGVRDQHVTELSSSDAEPYSRAVLAALQTQPQWDPLRIMLEADGHNEWLTTYQQRLAGDALMSLHDLGVTHCRRV